MPPFHIDALANELNVNPNVLIELKGPRRCSFGPPAFAGFLLLFQRFNLLQGFSPEHAVLRAKIPVLAFSAPAAELNNSRTATSGNLLQAIEFGRRITAPLTDLGQNP
jgi:hypothetical protein